MFKRDLYNFDWKFLGDFKELIGKSFDSVYREDEEIIFMNSDNPDEVFVVEHRQDCCEAVGIEDIVGDLEDLKNTPILVSESVSNNDIPPKGGEYPPESYTWTFIKFRTIKGSVDIRFYGESNGYYSESADLSRYVKE